MASFTSTAQNSETCHLTTCVYTARVQLYLLDILYGYMYACMSVSVCVYTYLHMYKHIYMHVYIHIYICIQSYSHVCRHMGVWIWIPTSNSWDPRHPRPTATAVSEAASESLITALLEGLPNACRLSLSLSLSLSICIYIYSYNVSVHLYIYMNVHMYIYICIYYIHIYTYIQVGMYVKAMVSAI